MRVLLPFSQTRPDPPQEIQMPSTLPFVEKSAEKRIKLICPPPKHTLAYPLSSDWAPAWGADLPMVAKWSFYRRLSIGIIYYTLFERYLREIEIEKFTTKHDPKGCNRAGKWGFQRCLEANLNLYQSLGFLPHIYIFPKFLDAFWSRDNLNKVYSFRTKITIGYDL